MTNQQTAISQQPHQPGTEVLQNGGPPPAGIIPYAYDQVYGQYLEPVTYYVQGQQPYVPMDPSVCVRMVQPDYMLLSKQPLNSCSCSVMPQIPQPPSPVPEMRHGNNAFKPILTLAFLALLGGGLFIGSRLALHDPVVEQPIAKIANLTMPVV